LEFFDNQGFYIQIIPEFYKEGINWNLQIIWYTDKEKWSKKTEQHIKEHLTDGTIMYGDNNEFPTREIANDASYVLAFELLERKLTGKKLLPEFFEERKGDILNFHKLLHEIRTD
jgi:hypothetical protein